jgi:hypothetical protein
VALEGGPIEVIGRQPPGVSRDQANAELRVFGERTAAERPATHESLRPSVRRIGQSPDMVGFAQLALRNVPALLMLATSRRPRARPMRRNSERVGIDPSRISR